MEAWLLMLSSHNILHPATGHPIAIPSQDMILGCYYLTRPRDGEVGENSILSSYTEARLAIENKEISLHAKVSFRHDDKLIKETLSFAKTIAMVGISSIKKEESTNIKRRPSIIVMKYLQEFGYKVIPVNPFSVGKKIYGETIVAKLEDIDMPIDIVDVFRPSNEAPALAQEAIKIGAKVFWLQYGIQSQKAKEVVEKKNIIYISNKCIKQEYQRLFLKVSPVFPALKN